MNSDLPKQFHLLAGLPVLIRSINAFVRFDPDIKVVVALPELYHDYWKELCIKHAFVILHQVVKGGETRFHSVENSLEIIPGDFIVAIHDAVRPLVSQKTIARTFDLAEKKGNAIPVSPVRESIRITDDDQNHPVSRDSLRIIQTPQVFRAKEIKEAYAGVSHSDFTDDACVLESSGKKLNLVEGNPENIKITLPYDLVVAEAILKNFSVTD
jgi:2-C-methyl-D-erythritol 4-phosphate cytidylyltransferase